MKLLVSVFISLFMASFNVAAREPVHLTFFTLKKIKHLGIYYNT